MELTDEAKAEIKAAIDILKSDGIQYHKTYKSFLASQEPPKTDPPKPDPPKTDPTGGPPPKADPTAGLLADPPKKRSLWFGDRE